MSWAVITLMLDIKTSYYKQTRHANVVSLTVTFSLSHGQEEKQVELK